MPTLNDLKAEIDIYARKYRHPDLAPFKENGLYDLYPENNVSTPGVVSMWPEPFPSLNEAGVYAFLSQDLEVLYIGKASMSHGLGYRLSSYCSYGENKSCKLNHKWIGRPRYIFTVAMPMETKFEAPGLEEYLIGKIPTDNNKAGAIYSSGTEPFTESK